METAKEKWLEPLLEWNREYVNVEALPSGWTVIGTPMTDADGDGICIYVHEEDGVITLSDDTYFMEGYRPLSEDSPVSEKKRHEQAIRMAESYSIRCEDGELLMDTTPERYADDFHTFLRVLVMIADFLGM